MNKILGKPHHDQQGMVRDANQQWENVAKSNARETVPTAIRRHADNVRDFRSSSETARRES